MATLGELNITLGGDASNFEAAIKSGEKNLLKLTRALTAAGQDLQKFNLETLDVLRGVEGEIGRTSDKLVKDLKVISSGLVDQGKAASTSQEGIWKLATAEIAGAKSARDHAKSLKEAEKAAMEYEKTLKSASNSLWLMNNALRQIGFSLTAAFTVPLGAAATLGVKTFADWEKGTVSIQRAAEITRESAERITQSFIEISQTVPITVEELQKAAFAAAQAGVTGEEAIENFAVAATKLAKVGGDAFKDLGIEELANQLAKLSIAFGITGENMQQIDQVASLLLGVAKSVPGGLAEIVEALRRVAGVASDAGLSLETTTALVGTLVAAAVPASRAGTELSRVIREMFNNTKELGEVLGYTGDELTTLEQRMETDFDSVVLEAIARIGQFESAVDRQRIATELFGEVGGKAFLPLINNTELVMALMERANAEFDDGTLLAQEFAVQADSLSGTFQVFKNNVQAVAQALGKDLAPYVATIAGVMISFLQKAVAGWKALSPGIKTAVIAAGAFLAILGPLTLALNTLFLQPISGIITFVTFLTRLRGTVTALLLPLTAVNTQMVTLQAASVAAAAGQYGLASSMIASATASTGLMASLGALLIPLAILAGKILIVVGALALLAKAFGVKLKFPKIETPDFGKLGFEPGEAPQITTEDLTGDQERITEAEKEAAKERQKEIEKELKEKKKLRDKELDILDDNIKAIEKQRKSELKVLEDSVDEQRDIIDERKDLWEDEADVWQEQIDAQKETLDIAQKSLKEAKKTLNALKKVRDGEVDTAEGQVEIAENSLKAAQEALKREVLLGHDEYDASYRAAEERVKAAEAALQLARENVVKIKREYEAQVEAQEEIVTTIEEQVDTQQEALDALRDAYDKRKKIVDDEIEILQDELEVRQDALENLRESYDEKLDILREERDAVKEAYDDEIDLIQDRLDAIREQNEAIADMELPEAPKIDEGLQEWLDAIKKQTENINNMDIGGFGITGPEVEIEEGGLLDRMKIAFDKAKTEAEEAGKGVIGAFLAGMGAALYTLGQAFWGRLIIDGIFGEGTSAELEEQAAAQGTSIGGLLLQGLAAGIANSITGITDSIMSALFGEDKWTEIKAEAGRRGLEVPQYFWEQFLIKLGEIKDNVVTSIFDALFGEGAWESIKTEAQSRGQSIPQVLWDGFVLGLSNFTENIKTKIDETFIQPLRDLATLTPEEAKKAGEEAAQKFIDGIKAKFEEVKTNVKTMIDNFKIAIEEKWEDIKTSGKDIVDKLWEGIKSKATEFGNNITNFVKDHIPAPIRKLLGLSEDVGEETGEAVEKGFEEGASGSKEKGGNIITNFINGLKSNDFGIQNAIESAKGFVNRLNDKANEASTWGSNLVSNFASGIRGGYSFVSNAVSYVSGFISRLWQSFSPPKEGILSNIDSWGENLTKTYAEGMEEGKSSIESSLDVINSLIQSLFGNLDTDARAGALQSLVESIRESLGGIGSVDVGEVFSLEGLQRSLESAKNIGKQIAQALSDGLKETISTLAGAGDFILSSIFGADTINALKGRSQESGTSVASILWESFKESIANTWTQFGAFATETLFGDAVWNPLNNEAVNKAVGIVESLWEGVKTQVGSTRTNISNFTQENVIEPVKSLFGAMFRTGQEAAEQTKQGLQTGGQGTDTVGSNIIQNFINGLGNYYGIYNVFGNIKNALQNNLGNMAGSAWSWGYNLIKSLRDGMDSAKGWLSDTANSIGNSLRRLWEAKSPPKEGVLRNIDKWGRGLIKTFAESMVSAVPELTSVIDELNSQIEDSLGSVSLGELAISPVVGGIGANTSVQAEQAAIPALAREARLAEQTAQTTQNVVNRNYNIQPGNMIASRGEIRNFVRMLKDYEQLESER